MSNNGGRVRESEARLGNAAKTGIHDKKEGGLMPARDLIGQKLRQFYDQVTREPIPDRFRALLDELELKDVSKGPS